MTIKSLKTLATGMLLASSLIGVGCTHYGPTFGVLGVPIPVTPYLEDEQEDEFWEHERYDRVPILGEIPVLNLLFSSTHTKDARTNLLFFIRPRLITPSGDTGLGVIVPPTESRPEGGK